MLKRIRIKGKKMARTLLFNGKVITPYRIIRNGSLLIEGGKIAGIFQGRPRYPTVGL